AAIKLPLRTLGIGRGDHVFAVAEHIRTIARAHQRLGRLGARTSMHAQAAALELAAAAAWTRAIAWTGHQLDSIPHGNLANAASVRAYSGSQVAGSSGPIHAGPPVLS